MKTKKIEVIRYECINRNGARGGVFSNLESVIAQKDNYSSVSHIVKLTGSYEVEIPEKKIEITESDFKELCFASRRRSEANIKERLTIMFGGE